MKTLLVKTCLLMSFALAIGTLSSCNDEQLTRDAVGTWKMEIETEDGTETTYFALHKDGVLEETCYYRQTETEEDITVVTKFKSTIQGTWEIVWGDLELSYELSSLNVTYTGMDFPGHSGTEQEIAGAFVEAFFDDEIKSAKNELMEYLREYYATSTCFSNLEIKDSNMTMEAEDGVVAHLKKQPINH
ncbi:MAG: hypothetical protein LBQ31_04425 [Bacteroidales bacterium]|jgi:hypothetical protein|nr:hypothetical protein [Bacteroidales bacterium]